MPLARIPYPLLQGGFLIPKPSNYLSSKVSPSVPETVNLLIAPQVGDAGRGVATRQPINLMNEIADEPKSVLKALLVVHPRYPEMEPVQGGVAVPQR
jgi:hypothetical protein